MILLKRSVAAWGRDEFAQVFKDEVQQLSSEQLPLQQGLAQSSYVSDSPFSASILSATETTDTIQVKAGILYAGIIAGSCCADDPTPVCEQTEYCELLFIIDKATAETRVSLANTN